MTVEIVIRIGGQPLVAELDDDALAAIATAVTPSREHETQSELLTVKEAAELLRARPQRIYDLLSARRLERVKDGSRTLIRRSDLVAYLAGDGLARHRGAGTTRARGQARPS